MKEKKVINKQLMNFALIYIEYVMNCFHRVFIRMYFCENHYWPYEVKKCQFGETVRGLILLASEDKMTWKMTNTNNNNKSNNNNNNNDISCIVKKEKR